MPHLLKNVKYIVQPVLTTEFVNEFKKNCRTWNIFQICSTFLHHLKNNEMQECITELEQLLIKNKDDTFVLEQLSKVWHLFYDYLTCKQDNPIFNIPNV